MLSSGLVQRFVPTYVGVSDQLLGGHKEHRHDNHHNGDVRMQESCILSTHTHKDVNLTHNEVHASECMLDISMPHNGSRTLEPLEDGIAARILNTVELLSRDPLEALELGVRRSA